MKKINMIALLALVSVTLLGASTSQFPAQRFSKVTASQAELTTLTLAWGSQPLTLTAFDVARWNSLKSGISEELDPVFRASVAGRITPAEVDKWNKNALDSPWLASPAYPGELQLRRSLSLAEDFGSPCRLLVQGYLPQSGWSGNLSIPSSDPDGRAYHNWGNFPGGAPTISQAFDHRGDTSAAWSNIAAGAYWLAQRLDAPARIGRVTLWRMGNWEIPWSSFSVWGANDSANGQDGTWTQLSKTFTVIPGGTGSVVSYDFTENAESFSWIRLQGDPTPAGRYCALTEIEFYRYSPAPDKKFTVDARGNPATDGTMTAAALALTTNSLTQTITPQDIRNWNTNLAAWSPLLDGAAITSRQAQVAIGATAINTERLLVQGFLPTSTYNPFSERPLTSFDANVYVFTSSNWNYWPAQPVFDGSPVGEWWRPNTGAQWIAYKNPSGLARVVSRVSFYEGGYWVPFDTFQVLGSNDSTNGADGTWTLLGGPFLARSGAGWLDYDLPGNAAAFRWHKIAGSLADLSSRVTYEIRFSTYSPAPDKKFTVDAHGNPGTDGTMTAGTYYFTPLSVAPDSPTTGTAYFDNIIRKLRVWDGAAWRDAW